MWESFMYPYMHMLHSSNSLFDCSVISVTFEWELKGFHPRKYMKIVAKGGHVVIDVFKENAIHMGISAM